MAPPSLVQSVQSTIPCANEKSGRKMATRYDQLRQKHYRYLLIKDVRAYLHLEVEMLPEITACARVFVEATCMNR